MPPGVAEPQTTVSDAQVAAAGKGLFVWPVRGDITDSFGPKPGGQKSDGLTIAAPLGAPVDAAAGGDVVYVGSSLPGFGDLVLIRHEGGWVSVYAHLSHADVHIKDHVAQGDVIGEVGQSGGVAQPELYFEIRYAPAPHEKPKPIDPTLVLPK
jgi:septal ring factor EnvC (AmiA/AmiB activator)